MISISYWFFKTNVSLQSTFSTNTSHSIRIFLARQDNRFDTFTSLREIRKYLEGNSNHLIDIYIGIECFAINVISMMLSQSNKQNNFYYGI